jgi:glyoxylase-like metal-dependent hydrolase (beta-lactamase superfamily II)
MNWRFLLIAAGLAGLAHGAAAAEGTIERLYVMDCGHGRASDMSRWTPGLNVGTPFDVRDNCYLIRHAQGWVIWDTGIPEAVARMPDGLVGGGGTMVWKRPKTMAAQFAEIGVTPADVKLVAISHTHPDHVGNVGMFPAATVLLQKAEHDWAFAPTRSFPFAADIPTRKLDGDFDVFGDGSVRILSTPGHTPGHQVLLVRMAKAGYVLLSGDAVHFRDNWENRRVPSMNVSKEQTLASLQRIADVLQQHKAELWINHDQAQSAKMKRPPEYYD